MLHDCHASAGRCSSRAAGTCNYRYESDAGAGRGNSWIKPAVLAADAGYGTGPFLAGLQARAVVAPIPVRDYPRVSGGRPRAAFTFEAERQVFICPPGQTLKYRMAVPATRVHTDRANCRECRPGLLQQPSTGAPPRTRSVAYDEAALLVHAPETEGTGRRRRRVLAQRDRSKLAPPYQAAPA